MRNITTKIPPEGMLLFGILMVSAFGYNFVAVSKYKKLMSRLQRYHPQIYEQIRMKPDLGSFYSSGNHSKPIIDYAKNHEPLDDSIAEQLLTDYVEFYEKGSWIFGIIFVLAIVGMFTWAIFSP